MAVTSVWIYMHLKFETDIVSQQTLALTSSLIIRRRCFNNHFIQFFSKGK